MAEPLLGRSPHLEHSDAPDLERTSSYDYELPEELVALHPMGERDASRLLVVVRDRGTLADRSFRDLPDYLAPGDAIVLNDSRVFPARLRGRKPTGANAEVLLLRPLDGSGSRWESLVRPGSKLKPGSTVIVADGLTVRIEDSTESGGREVRLLTEEEPWAAIERHGSVPLPPYIDRPSTEEDRRRYQTVYAAHRGSVAAPTAGLHFTWPMLERIEKLGVRIARVTLHVGPGTFRPVEADRVAEHRLDAEAFSLGEEAAGVLSETKRAGGRIWAVGTTTVRVLESLVRDEGSFEAGSGWTDLFIHPPFRFRAVDRLVTNFHLPRSTLLMLVAAFAGHELTLAAYRHATEARYRFYSYGDAMLLL